MNKVFTKGFWRISPITRRILAVNVGALLILGFGLLYSGQYERELIRTELNALAAEGRLLAAALAEGGARDNAEGDRILAEDLSRHMLRKLSEENPHRTILFTKTGDPVLDSHQLLGPGGIVEIMPLEAPFSTWSLRNKLQYLAQEVLDVMPIRLRLPQFPARDENKAQDYPGILETLNGESQVRAWRNADGKILLTVSLPIQNLKNVLGAVLLMKDGASIDLAVREVQFSVVKFFLYALFVTVLLTIYLSETIARPLLRLAGAAERVKRSLLLKDSVPDLSYRRDEIGQLSVAFRDMTNALSDRIDAISNFAADVAHEIKNPLASVKSAVETLMVVKEEGQRNKLLAILNDDVDRLNRLITDISNASRLDSEVSRAEKKGFDIGLLVAEAVRQAGDKRKMHDKVRFTPVRDRKLVVTGNDVQIYQVVSNLLDNAFSFVSDSGKINIEVIDDRDKIIIHVDNDGPPVPEEKLETIFTRFYSERPKTEKFGLHSGLGLSISRQIIKAHQGTIFAENMKDRNGTPVGVRFSVILPKGA